MQNQTQNLLHLQSEAEELLAKISISNPEDDQKRMHIFEEDSTFVTMQNLAQNIELYKSLLPNPQITEQKEKDGQSLSLIQGNDQIYQTLLDLTRQELLKEQLINKHLINTVVSLTSSLSLHEIMSGIETAPLHINTPQSNIQLTNQSNVEFQCKMTNIFRNQQMEFILGYQGKKKDNQNNPEYDISLLQERMIKIISKQSFEQKDEFGQTDNQMMKQMNESIKIELKQRIETQLTDFMNKIGRKVDQLKSSSSNQTISANISSDQPEMMSYKMKCCPQLFADSMPTFLTSYIAFDVKTTPQLLKQLLIHFGTASAQGTK